MIYHLEGFSLVCVDESGTLSLSFENKFGGSTPAVSPNQNKKETKLHTIAYTNKLTNCISSIITCYSLLII
jgi:hypothetical protein